MGEPLAGGALPRGLFCGEGEQTPPHRPGLGRLFRTPGGERPVAGPQAERTLGTLEDHVLRVLRPQCLAHGGCSVCTVKTVCF